MNFYLYAYYVEKKKYFLSRRIRFAGFSFLSFKILW